MSTEYATKYASQVDERFKEISRSSECVNQDYEFTGSKTVKVYSVNTAQMHDYSRSDVSGASRYGTLENLEATTQELTMSKDRSFTFVIDKADMDETALALEAGKALDRQLREVVKPEVDTYRFAKMCEKAGNRPNAVELTSDNIYDQITAGTEALDNKEVPEEGRFIIVTPNTYKLMKQCPSMILDTEVGQEMRLKGVVAIYDGMEVIKVPSNRLPGNIGFLIGNKMACTAPIKLAEYKTHQNPPGISGYLVEGRIYYDAFVLNNKANALYYQEVPTLTVNSVAGSTSGNTAITVTPAKAEANSYVYKTDTSVDVPVSGTDCSTGYTSWDGSANITATTNNEIVIVEVDSNSKAVKAGKAKVKSKA